MEDEGTIDSLPHRCYKLKRALEENPEMLSPGLDPIQRKQVLVMLLRTATIFATDIEDLHEPARVAPLRIDTGGHPPIKLRPYKLAADEVKLLAETIEKQKKARVVETSHSPWSFPTFVTYRKTLGL